MSSVSGTLTSSVSECIPVPSSSEPISSSPSVSQPPVTTSSASFRPTCDPAIPEESGGPSVTRSLSASVTISTSTSERVSQSMSQSSPTTRSTSRSVTESGSVSPTRTSPPPRPTRDTNGPSPPPEEEMSTPREPSPGPTPKPSPSRSPSASPRPPAPTRSPSVPPRVSTPPRPSNPAPSNPPRPSNPAPSNPPRPSNPSPSNVPPPNNPTPSNIPPANNLSDPPAPSENLVPSPNLPQPSDIPIPDGRITSTSTLTTITSVSETLSTPVPVSVTDSLNGNVQLTTPPFITSLSTSTQPDGQTVVITQIVANPTGFVNAAASRPSFFEDQGKTAGVFLVVGIVAAALIFGIFFLFRRRRRKARQRRWLATIPPSRPQEDPFADPRPPTTMREMGSTRNASSIWDGRRVPVPEYYIPDPPQSPTPPAPSQLAPPPPPPPRNPNRAGDMRRAALLRQTAESDAGNGTIGLALIGDKKEFSRSQTSFAQSSPSLYPQSLPPADDDDVSFYELESKRPPPIQTRLEPQRLVFPSNEHSYAARMVGEKSRTFMLTPPLTSDSSSTDHEPPSPDFDRTKMVLPTEPVGVFTKPTLLNVRRRDTFGVV